MPVALLSVTGVLLCCVVAGDARTPLPGIRSALALVSFAPFALCASVGGMWLSPYSAWERAGVRRPAALRACRAGVSCLLALAPAWWIAHTASAPPELWMLTVGCLVGGLATACVVPRLWWAAPLCVNYAYYATRLSFGDEPAAVPVALGLLGVAVLAFSGAADRPG